MEHYKKYKKYKQKYLMLKQNGGLGKGEYYERLGSPYEYGGDFAVAKLYVDAKDSLSYPLTKNNIPLDFFKFESIKNTNYYTDILNNKYISYYNIDADNISAGEKLLIAIVCKIYTMIGDNSVNLLLETEKYILIFMEQNPIVDLSKLGDIIRLLVFLKSSNKSIMSPLTDTMRRILSGHFFMKVNQIYDIVTGNDSLFLTKYLANTMPKNYRTELLANIFTRTGAYGINTLLLLFFNELIAIGTGSPIQCEEGEICIHADTREDQFDMMAHDMDHGSRIIAQMMNRRWFGYLKLCYMIIINTPSINKNLLFYLFVVINEIGGEGPLEIQNFEKSIHEHFSPKSGSPGKYIRVENDLKFLKMMEQIKCADENLTFSANVDIVSDPSIGKENDLYTYSCLMNLHREFDKHFNIIKACSPLPSETMDSSIRKEIINIISKLPDELRKKIDPEIFIFTKTILD